MENGDEPCDECNGRPKWLGDFGEDDVVHCWKCYGTGKMYPTPGEREFASDTRNLLIPNISFGKFAVRSLRLENRSDFRGLSVHLTLDVNNVVDGKPTEVHLQREISRPALRYASPREVRAHYLVMVRAMAHDALEHELDEWFRIDGVRPSDPHANDPK